MENEFGFGRASMILLLIGLVGTILAAALGQTPSAKAEMPAQDYIGAVRMDAAPMAHKVSTDSLVVKPTGLRMTIDWSLAQGGDPVPNDVPYGRNVRVWDNANEQSKPSMTVQPTTGDYYLAFQHYNGADWDIYLTRSQDDGDTWATPYSLVDSDANETNPSIASPSGGGLVLAYEHDGKPDLLHFFHSADGSSWNGFTLDVASMQPLTDFKYPTVVSQRDGGSYPNGIMFQMQAFCDDATSCGGGAHTAFWIGTGYASNDPIDWNLDLGGVFWLVDPGPGGFHLADPLHPSAWWSSSNYFMVMDLEVTDQAEWKILWSRISQNGWPVEDGWTSVATSDDGIFAAGAADGGCSVIAGAFRSPSDPTRHQILYLSTNDSWNSNHSGTLDAAITDQRAVSVAGAGTQFHVTYYSDAVMSDALVDTEGGVTLIKVSDNTGTAVNDEKATSVTINSHGTPVIAWQDDRDGNVDIYTTGYLSYPIAVNSTCGGVPWTGGILIDGWVYVQTPYFDRWYYGTTHTVQVIPLMQMADFSKLCGFTQWDDGGTAPTKTITMTGPLNLTVMFADYYRVQFDTYPVPLNLTWRGMTQIAPIISFERPGTYTLEAPSPQSGAIPDERYSFVNWSDGVTDNQRTIVVGTGCTNLTANFREGYLVKIKTDPTGLRVSIDSGPYTASPVEFWATEGSMHSVILAGTQYDPINPDSVRYRFIQWDNGVTTHGLNFTVSGPYTATAIFDTQYKLDLPSPETGDVRCVNRPDCWYYSGELATVELTTPWPPAAVYIRHVFSGWSGDAMGMSNPITLTMDSPKTVYANWATQYKVTVTTAYSTVTCSPNSDCWFGVGLDAILTLSDTIVGGGTGTRYVFMNWNGDASGNSNPVTVTMDSPKNVTTVWATQYKVTKNTPYSSLTCSPNADCWFDDGSTATVTLADLTVPGGPGTKYNFKEWAGDVSGTSNPVTLTVDAPKDVAATWTTQHKLTVNTAHSTYSCSPNSDCWFDEDSNGVVTLSEAVVPGGSGTRYVFNEWTGDASGSSLTLTVTMVGPKSVMAVWDTQHKISVTTDHSTVTCSPMSDCWFLEGSTATITLAETIVPGDVGTRHAFKHWAGDLSGNDSEVDITVDESMNITAVWSTQYLLIITSDCGSYSNCGSPTGAGWYDEDAGAVAQVTTPYTDPSGGVWDFSNWTGDANGTSPTLSLTMDGPKSVDANWISEEGSGGHQGGQQQQSPMDATIWAIAAAVVAAIAASAITYLMVRRKKPPEDEMPFEESETDELMSKEQTQ